MDNGVRNMKFPLKDMTNAVLNTKLGVLNMVNGVRNNKIGVLYTKLPLKNSSSGILKIKEDVLNTIYVVIRCTNLAWLSTSSALSKAAAETINPSLQVPRFFIGMYREAKPQSPPRFKKPRRALKQSND